MLGKGHDTSPGHEQGCMYAYQYFKIVMMNMSYDLFLKKEKKEEMIGIYHYF